LLEGILVQKLGVESYGGLWGEEAVFWLGVQTGYVEGEVRVGLES